MTVKVREHLEYNLRMIAWFHVSKGRCKYERKKNISKTKSVCFMLVCMSVCTIKISPFRLKVPQVTAGLEPQCSELAIGLVLY